MKRSKPVWADHYSNGDKKPLIIFTSTIVARFLESRGMLEDALEVATNPNYRFHLAIQLGRLDVAKMVLVDCLGFTYTFYREDREAKIFQVPNLQLQVPNMIRKFLSKYKVNQNGSTWETSDVHWKVKQN